MTGYDDLPRPADAPTGKTVFYDAQYRGERIRVAALFTAMPAHPPVVVVTQVAETVGGRRALIRTILVHALGQQLLLLLLGAALVWLGVTRQVILPEPRLRVLLLSVSSPSLGPATRRLVTVLRTRS